MDLELNIDERFKKFLISKYNDGSLLGVGGIHYIFRFPNNYGASVVKGKYTYGGDADLWETALIYYYDTTNYYELVYEKDFEDDVIGYLTTCQVNELLGKIMSYDDKNDKECEEHEENEPGEMKGEITNE